jgi:hypothetical protein
MHRQSHVIEKIGRVPDNAESGSNFLGLLVGIEQVEHSLLVLLAEMEQHVLTFLCKWNAGNSAIRPRIVGILFRSARVFAEGELVRTFTGRGVNHFANFLQAIRSRDVSSLNAGILEGHQSTALCHIGNISYRLGHPAPAEEIQRQLSRRHVHDDLLDTFERTRRHLLDNNVDLERPAITLGPWLRLDSENESFIDNPAADALLTREYRRPFVLPEEQEI